MAMAGWRSPGRTAARPRSARGVCCESRIEMTEEGIAYTVDILEQDDARLRLRSHNPGEPVKITLVPAAAPAQ